MAMSGYPNNTKTQLCNTPQWFRHMLARRDTQRIGASVAIRSVARWDRPGSEAFSAMARQPASPTLMHGYSLIRIYAMHTADMLSVHPQPPGHQGTVVECINACFGCAQTRAWVRRARASLRAVSGAIWIAPISV